MKILVLGGTRFVGRHIVETLSAQGHCVTAFHRGQTICDLPAGVRAIYGDRDLPLPEESFADDWDAIIDVSGRHPDQLRRSLELEAAWYLFISTINVYADLSQAGVDESSPTIREFDPDDGAMAYGGNKAACERLAHARYGDRSTILRCGIIVGAWDYTGRFTYWPRRALRGGPFIVPAPASRPVQFIDVRDLAAFVAYAVTTRLAGVYNTVGPAERFSQDDLAQACVLAAAERGIVSEARYVDGDSLIARGVEPWTDIPMWLHDPALAGAFAVDNHRAIAHGARVRPPIESVRALMDWLATPESAAMAAPGLPSAREAALIAERAREDAP